MRQFEATWMRRLIEYFTFFYRLKHHAVTFLLNYLNLSVLHYATDTDMTNITIGKDENILTLKMPNFRRRYFSEKTNLDISCESSAKRFR